MKTIHPAIAEHVMAENEKLRGLLEAALFYVPNAGLRSDISAALSQQAEPCQDCDNFGDVHGPDGEYIGRCKCGKSEPAPAQSETNDQIAAIMLLHGTPGQQAEAARYAGLPAGAQDERETIIVNLQRECARLGALTNELEQRLATRPAQAEQQPVAVVKENNHCPEGLSDEISEYLPHGTKLYAAPIAQAAPQPEPGGLYTCIGKGGAYELIGRATTAGVLKVTGRFADEVIVYRDTESNALYCRAPGDFRLRMALSALSAQRGEE
ncbi:hypothetical protein [Stutzerimonas nitrititolerans]|uniref:hypothetical protein n=1 Tax=Stutzerimonas nitrititolerans TaxID=2482751 RepID=UPI0028ABB91B|nr:hypothetical protein [Stutzerimonas nitrititolerans]